jgi:hypothetical protein
MKTSHNGRLATLLAGAIPMLGMATLSSAEPAPAAPPADMATSLRVSPSQYKLAIADIFGTSVRVDGRFEPEMRDQGLLAIGARTENVTDSGLESYDGIARAVAAQVVDERHRAEFLGCKPHADVRRDDQCARKFFSRVGTLLYRRPLSDEELKARVATAGAEADRLHDFYSGVRLSLAEMLISPEFLFRFKRTEPDPQHRGQERMNAYDMASELSFFLWGTTPDPELMRAARSGELYTNKGLAKQVNRMIGSPRIAAGVRAFFADMLEFTDFDAVSKDPAFFPRFTLNLKDEAQEQTLRTIVDHIVTRHGDYRDLFTTPNTFLTKDLAALYSVPLVDVTANGELERWLPYTYPANDPRVGILSEASFTTLWSPSGRTSPTVRGKALRQNILCQKVPPPPGNVSFKFVDDVNNPKLKTTRDRLTAHRADALCAGCHKLTDPLGLALENFDSAGEYRTTENGVVIDASGEINGKKFDGPLGLAQAVHDDPSVTSCVAQRTFAFETGYLPPKDDPQWKEIQQKFADSHYDVLELMRQIALSNLSYRPPESKVMTAAN